MTAPLRLVIFDVDGTLVDSQASILAAMQAAFDGQGLTLPSRDRVLSIVGLSLDEGMAELAASHSKPVRDQMVADYKAAFQANRQQLGPARPRFIPALWTVLNNFTMCPRSCWASPPENPGAVWMRCCRRMGYPTGS